MNTSGITAASARPAISARTSVCGIDYTVRFIARRTDPIVWGLPCDSACYVACSSPSPPARSHRDDDDGPPHFVLSGIDPEPRRRPAHLVYLSPVAASSPGAGVRHLPAAAADLAPSQPDQTARRRVDEPCRAEVFGVVGGAPNSVALHRLAATGSDSEIDSRLLQHVVKIVGK